MGLRNSKVPVLNLPECGQLVSEDGKMNPAARADTTFLLNRERDKGSSTHHTVLCMNFGSVSEIIQEISALTYMPANVKKCIHECSIWRLLMPFGMFCFAHSVIEKVIDCKLCYEINVNEQIEFHTLSTVLQKSLLETEVYGG